MCIVTPIKSPTDRPIRADWQALQVGLDRCYVGAPAGKRGFFTGTVFTLCQLLQGSAEFKRDAIHIATDASYGEWNLCVPGERWQTFSDDADIISIHLSVSNPGNGAEWQGPRLVSIQPDATAKAALDALMASPALAHLSQRQRLEIRGLSFTLDDMLALQVASAHLFRHALRLGSSQGMRYEPPPIEDERVRASHRWLASLGMGQDFSRDELAAAHGLSAGQLDRLWRAELGITPRQYHDRNRFTYACEQLRRRSSSVKIVAADLGFRHLSQFSNWFRAHLGESPRAFRNRPETN